MASNRIKGNSLHVMLDDEMHKKLQAKSKEKGKPMSEIAREFIYRGLSDEAAEESLDVVEETIRRTLKQVLKPNVDRIIAMVMKSGKLSGTAAYLGAEILGHQGKADVKSAWDSAQKKAVNQLKQHETIPKEGEE